MYSKRLNLTWVLFIVALVVIQVICQETSSSAPRRRPHHHRGPRRNGTRLEARNKTGSPDTEVRLTDEDKYFEGNEDEDYNYDYDDTTANVTADEDDNKFIETSGEGIVFDHVEFVALRLKHISARVSSNISEILALQKKEFAVNSVYEEGWAQAVKLFNTTQRAKIFNNTSPKSIVRTVPEEYHIALIAYTLGEAPQLYEKFNRDTREICGGREIDKYPWKSFFKLLQLAIETLGTQEARWIDDRRFLYRGASRKFDVKEGQVLAFQHFISTSSALTSAELFAGESLFEFQGFYNGTAMAIWDHSYYEHEREVLFSPLQVFQVDSIHVGRHYTRYVLVKHDLKSPCEENKEKNDQLGSNHSSLARSGGDSLKYKAGFVMALIVLASVVVYGN